MSETGLDGHFAPDSMSPMSSCFGCGLRLSDAQELWEPRAYHFYEFECFLGVRTSRTIYIRNGMPKSHRVNSVMELLAE